ncbi:MAG: hypothetical protein JO250_14700 [Armatimonadetes bacterium]|nr:hypothetical protein [Armatimonadota bacterium]
MNWLDLVLILVIGGAVVLEMVRGIGRAAFDALLLYAALWGADAAALPLAARVHLADGAAVNHADIYALLLVTFGVAALGVARFLYGMTQFDAGMFEALLGLGAGAATGMIAAHGIVRALAMADPTGTAGAATVAGSFVGHEMLTFPTYHAVMDTVTGATSYRRELPDLGGK